MQQQSAECVVSVLPDDWATTGLAPRVAAICCVHQLAAVAAAQDRHSSSGVDATFAGKAAAHGQSVCSAAWKVLL